MTAGHRDEKAINASLGKALGSYHPRCTVMVERTGMLKNAGKQPDFVIEIPGRERIIIENKYAKNPTTFLEDDCKNRLNEKWMRDGEPVRIVIGLRTPDRLDKCSDETLDMEISDANDFLWAVWQNSNGNHKRYPETGWIPGSLADLSAFADRAGLDSVDTDGLINEIQTCIRSTSDQVGELDEVALGTVLYQSDGEQTNLMAMAVMFNAAVFQGHVAKHHPTILSPTQMIADGVVTQVNVLSEWQKILDINYYPIFGVSRKLLRSFKDEHTASSILLALYKTAAHVSAKAFDAQGLIGKLFGQLIADKKLLATYYTLPSSAVLLAELAVSKLNIDWSDTEAVSSLRVGDLACGTGALLVSAYRRIAERYRIFGGDDADIHTRMIEDVFLGCDIFPPAVHLTAAILAGEHPSVDYTASQTWLVPYGRIVEHRMEAIRIGSLELLTSDFTPALFGDGTLAVTSTDEKSITQAQVVNSSLDLVIMNPPFTRPVGQEAEKCGIPNPAFAGLGNDEKDQKDMTDTLKKFYKQLKKVKGPFADDAKAGLATNFFDLANLKIKPGGILALILPSTAVSGSAWEKFRACLHRFYSDITVVSLAGAKSKDRSFSDSTGMAEAMIVATKREKPVSECDDCDATFLTLNSRPKNSVEAVECVRSSRQTMNDTIRIGDQRIGWTLQTSFPVSGAGTPEGVASTDVAYSAASLINGISGGLVLPQIEEQEIPLTRLSVQGLRGPYHMKIDANYQGCLKVAPLSDRGMCNSVSWPILWSHDKDLERSMVVEPCSEGRLPGLPPRYKSRHFVAEDHPDPWHSDDVLKLWNGNEEMSGATFLHINRDFRVNSQSLGACITSVKAIGGRAWPSFASSFGEKGEKAICLWLNTTLGLIGRWWVSTRQQQGRANLSVTTMGNIPAVDCNALSEEQFDEIENVFSDFKDRPMLPANECYRDDVRQDLDMKFLCGVLGMPEKILDPLSILRLQWCYEPSVHGGKKTRPAGIDL